MTSSRTKPKNIIVDGERACDAVPEKLFVSSPNGRKCCAGEYALFQWEQPNGQPLWKQTKGECWLYSSTSGRWVIGGLEAKNKGFACSTGYIASRQLHGGKMPQVFNGTWERARWHQDPGIIVAVGSSADLFTVTSPNGRTECAGEYVRVPGEMPNGYPLFKQVNEDHWLYSGTKGSWLIGGVEEKGDNFGCSSGVIVCGRVHNGASPDKCGASWWWTGRSLDDGICVTDKQPAKPDTAEDAPAIAVAVSSSSGGSRMCWAGLVLVLTVAAAAVSSHQDYLAHDAWASSASWRRWVILLMLDLWHWAFEGSSLIQKIKTANIACLLFLCLQTRFQASRALKVQDNELHKMRAHLARSTALLQQERSRLARLGEELKEERRRTAWLRDKADAETPHFCMDGAD